MIRTISIALSFFLAQMAAGDTFTDLAEDADIVLIGEVHDNPAHHQRQAELVRMLAPSAIVFEMITPEAAEKITDELRQDPAALEEMLGWEASGWPDFDMYYPIIAAAPQAKIYGGAVPREKARAAFEAGVAESFGPDADTYGLSIPLPDAEQAKREDFQYEAHCEALPKDLLPKMVALQRLRDAVLARATYQAWQNERWPVVVITGNGHVRGDWGIPVYLNRVDPGLQLLLLGQTEDENPLDGWFDMVFSSPAVDRPDPCEAFR